MNTLQRRGLAKCQGYIANLRPALQRACLAMRCCYPTQRREHFAAAHFLHGNGTQIVALKQHDIGRTQTDMQRRTLVESA